ncbi:MAG TPA: hypothetical protein VFM55_19215 [Micromonosporaceae bacterium]|nr:hypothetical protein [Micromonosporaceae bacterium]
MGNDTHCFRDDHAVWREVVNARHDAHLKHGDNSIEAEPADSPRWLAILGEEFGEVCNALTYDTNGDLRTELVQVVAVASAWIDALDDAAEKKANRPST